MSHKNSKKKVFYYQNLTDDLVKSEQQDFSLPENYQILKHNTASKIFRTLAAGFAYLYTYGILRVKVQGKEKLQPYKNKAYFVYANHTRPVNDAFMPLTLLGVQHYYALASQSNWGIPFIGKYLLPYGGLPVGKNIKESIKLLKAVKNVVKENGHIVIYPEAHVWPYYTKIRPFDDTSMNFPVSLETPSFVMTTTYQKSRHKRPKIVVYIDGPFFAKEGLPKKAKQEQLHKEIFDQMTKRSKSSKQNYYQYYKK